jgi:hypothetical protein
LSKTTAKALWAMRVTWGVVLVVSVSFLALPLAWGLVIGHEHLASGGFNNSVGPSGIWCTGEVAPRTSYLRAALLVLASIVVPAVVHRRSLRRLRRRGRQEIDPTQPTAYRMPPGTRARLADPEGARRSAAACHASRLALSLGLVAPLPLMAAPYLLHWTPHFSSCSLEPVPYAPLVLVAAGVIAIQFPTRRRVLRCIEDLSGA